MVTHLMTIHVVDVETWVSGTKKAGRTGLAGSFGTTRLTSAKSGATRNAKHMDRDLGFCFVVILHEVSDMIDDHQWIVRDRHLEIIEYNQALASRNEVKKI